MAGPVRPAAWSPVGPVDTLLRLLYLKHRYGLDYETLCREVADSISWRRFCRLPLDRPVPHPTTLVKLVGRAGPETIEQLNAALLTKLAQGRLLRACKLRSRPRWSRPTSTTRPTPTCWRVRLASWAGWCGGSRPAVPPAGPGSATAAVPLGGG